MRDREPVSMVARAVPPPGLRMFTDPSRPGHDGQDLGVNVYADHDAWLAARQEWAGVNGITVVEWLNLVTGETLEAGCTLAELNAIGTMYLVEDDDFTDPRLPAA